MEANQGQTRGTVEAVASSGEKSRILLLLETHLPPPQARSSAELGRRTLEWDGEMVVEHDQAGGLLQADILSDASGGGRLERVAAPCAVLYDEIDAHVGGRTAVAVGKLLANQGRDSQVKHKICFVFALLRGLQYWNRRRGLGVPLDGSFAVAPVSCGRHRVVCAQGEGNAFKYHTHSVPPLSSMHPPPPKKKQRISYVFFSLLL